MIDRKPNPKGYVVSIAESALIQLCQAGLEAYITLQHIPGQRRRRRELETYGQIWGHEARLRDGRTLYDVQMASVDTSALREPLYVQPEPKALDIKVDLMASCWPHLEFLGDFHTHPYGTVQLALKSKGYRLSEKTTTVDGTDGDIEAYQADTSVRRHSFRVALVLAIGRLKNKVKPNPDWIGDWATIQFTLSNFRMWIKSYIIQEEDKQIAITSHNSSDVFLACPALLGMQDLYTEFGKGGAGGYASPPPQKQF
jgi:hypothetical protein